MLIIENTKEDLSYSGLSTDDIIGIILGAVRVIAAIIAIIFCCYKYKNNMQEKKIIIKKNVKKNL